MKRIVLTGCLSLMLVFAGLAGCAPAAENTDDALSGFLSKLNQSAKIEYSVVKTTNLAESDEKQYVHAEYEKNPFALRQTIGLFNETSFVMLETDLSQRGERAEYSVNTAHYEPFDAEQLAVSENGNFTVTGTPAEHTEQSTELKGQEMESMIAYFDQLILYDIGDLIERNIDSFSQGETAPEDEDYIRYNGTFTVNSVLDRYSDTGREYVKENLKMRNAELALKDNPLREEMKDELMTLHDGIDIAEGIYEMVFAENPVPVSVWIPADAEKPYKIQIDYSEAYNNKYSKLYNLSPKSGEYTKTEAYMALFPQ